MNKTIYPLPRIHFLPYREIVEKRGVALFTNPRVWEAVGGLLNFQVVSRFDVLEADENDWKEGIARLEGEVIYAVGGGLVVDAAKYAASQTGKHLISLPSALSVDAFLTWASGVRRDGCVTYLETTIPNELVIDWAVIQQAPPGVRVGGICDVLSIATGLWDWRYAQEVGKNSRDTPPNPAAEKIAEDVLEAALDCTEAAGAGDPEGMKQLLDCLSLEVQLCNQIGHARPEEGSEHYFAYAVENRVGKGLPHGDLVGPGILIFADLQGQTIDRLYEALVDCHIELDRIPEEIILQTLHELPDYCRKHQLHHGLAHDLTTEMIQKVVTNAP